MLKVRNVYFVLLSIVMLVACKTNESNKTDNGPEVVPATSNDTVWVETAIVEPGNFTTETWCNGTLQAGQKAIVPFEIQGNLVEVHVHNGQKVTAGQLLAKIDDYRQQQDLAQALVNHKQALLDYEDQLLLSGYNTSDTGSIPAKVKSGAMLRSGLMQARLSLEKAKRELSNTRIIAPVGGTVAGMKAQAFTPTTEYKNFCTLLNTSYMVADFDVLESDAAIIKPGLSVKIMPVALPGIAYDGIITGTDPLLGVNGTLSITARVKNSDSKLLDGMKVKVVVNTKITDQLVVPKSAILARQNRQVVFTVENGHAIWNYVTTGYENSTQCTITEGLQPGQQIIVSNNLTIGHLAPVLVSTPHLQADERQ
jgi:RND family efflux transporter MFP subunit